VLAVVTGGLFALVNLVMAFVLPVAPTYAAWANPQETDERPG
jgi:hypothetical protein